MSIVTLVSRILVLAFLPELFSIKARGFTGRIASDVIFLPTVEAELLTETASSRIIGGLRGADGRLPDELSPDSGVAFHLVMTPMRNLKCFSDCRRHLLDFSVTERTSSPSDTSKEDNPEVILSLTLSKSSGVLIIKSIRSFLFLFFSRLGSIDYCIFAL